MYVEILQDDNQVGQSETVKGSFNPGKLHV